MRALKFHQVDVFTERPLYGNPLAVFLDADDLEPALMQRIAREMNLSETTFVRRSTDPACAFRVSIFTPGTELPFAGHPTVGTAFVLTREGMLDKPAFAFQMPVGSVPVRRDGTMFWIAPPKVQPILLHQPLTEFAAALRLAAGSCVGAYVMTNGVRFLCTLVATRDDVDRAEPDRQQLAKSTKEWGDLDILVFSYENGRAYSRMFPNPAYGITEDPATGGSIAPLCLTLKHCDRLQPQTSSITVEQGTKMGRQSFLHARFKQNAKDLRDVEVGGTAVHLFESELHIGDA